MSEPKTRQKALFLDRDGVINIDKGYVYKISDCEFVDGIFDLCLAARARGYLLIVVTNQSGIARGYYEEDDFLKFMKYMRAQFQQRGCPLDAVYYCPFHEEGIGAYRRASLDRKPEPGMLLRAAAEHNIDLASSILIGDSESDIIAGRRAGVGRNILIKGSLEKEISELFI